MLITPATYKPKFGDAELIPDHPIVPNIKLALLFNEGGGNIVWDLVSKKPYSFDATYKPLWDADGVKFSATARHIDGPPLNSILSAGSNGTILLGYKHTNIPLSYYVLFSVGDSINVFCCYSVATGYGDGMSLRLNNIYISNPDIDNFMNAKILGLTWYSSGANVYVTFYKDGKNVGGANATTSFPDSSLSLSIGGAGNLANRFAGGIYDFFYVINRVLSEPEIASISANPNQIVYDKSEMLVRSIWALGGASYIDLSMSCEIEADNTFNITRLRPLDFQNQIEIEVNASITRLRSLIFETLMEIENNIGITRLRGLNLDVLTEIGINLYLSRIIELTMTVLIDTNITMFISLIDELIFIIESLLGFTRNEISDGFSRNCLQPEFSREALNEGFTEVI